MDAEEKFEGGQTVVELDQEDLMLRLTKRELLGIMTLHDGMVLSTLSISSRGFGLGFPKRLHTSEDVFLIYKPMINPLISRRRTSLTTILNNPPIEYTP